MKSRWFRWIFPTHVMSGKQRDWDSEPIVTNDKAMMLAFYINCRLCGDSMGQWMTNSPDTVPSLCEPCKRAAILSVMSREQVMQLLKDSRTHVPDSVTL